MKSKKPDRVADAQKLRYNYLAKQSELQSQAGCALSAALVCALIVCLCILGCCNYADAVTIVVNVVLGATFAVAAIACWRYRKHRIREAMLLPVVPPVKEQMGALPDDEILVRGSEEPAASPDELVRAAQASEHAGQGELLRPGE